MPDLSERTILLTVSFFNYLFSNYLFSHYLFSYLIPHGLQHLPCQPLVILTHGLQLLLQVGVELLPDDFCDLLSHGPPHFLLFHVLVFAINPLHPSPILVKQFAQQTGR